MIYGYARVSTDGQSVAAQVAALQEAGAVKVWRETASGAQTDRMQLRKALATLAAGDVLMVLEADGELLIADGRNHAAFTPVKRYKVAEAATWAAPAFSGNRILVKDVSSVSLWTVN